MSTQTTAERSRKVISASHDQSQHDAFLFVVMRAVGESLSIARRTHEGVTEQLPIITMERGGDSPWRVEFDALDFDASQRESVESAVAKAYDDPWNREAVCLLVQPGDSLDDKPLAHLAAHANELHKALTAYIDEVNAGACPVATLAAHLQRTGARGVELAAVTVDTYTDNPARLLFNTNAPGLAVFPYYFADAIWRDEIQPRAEAGPPNPARVIVGDDNYMKVPKVMSATAWSVAGKVRIAGTTKIDGNEYANAPGATRYLPRAFAVAPGGKRPSQQTLGLALHEHDDQVSMFARTVNDTQALVNVDAGKLAAWFMVTGHSFNKQTLGELTRFVTPARQQVEKRDRERVASALQVIGSLGLVLPDDTSIRLFDVRAPNNPTQTTPDQIIAWTYTHTFRDALTSFEGSRFKALNRLRGWFIINFTELMNFERKQGLPMRLYLNACGMFNDSMNTRGQYDANFAPKYTLEQLAAQTNSLSQNAVDLLNEGKTTRSRSASKSRDLREVLEGLDYLESKGLVILEGTPKELKLIAPGEWQEAYNEVRKGGARPDYDK